jgi:hypothetical protein
VPRFFISSMQRWSSRLPCSIESTPGRDRREDPFRAVRVRGDLDQVAVRFLDDRAQLVVGELLRADLLLERQHACGGDALDHLGAVLDLLAHRAPAFVGSVDDAGLGPPTRIRAGSRSRPRGRR